MKGDEEMKKRNAKERKKKSRSNALYSQLINRLRARTQNKKQEMCK